VIKGRTIDSRRRGERIRLTILLKNYQGIFNIHYLEILKKDSGFLNSRKGEEPLADIKELPIMVYAPSAI